MLKWLTISFVFLILLIIVLANAGQLDILGFINKLPHGDKAGHFILYGILTLLLNLTFIRSNPHRSPGMVISSIGIVLALLIGIEEYSQKYISNRTFSLADLAASYIGVLFFSWVVLRIKK